jgi:hypothetical protein
MEGRSMADIERKSGLMAPGKPEQWEYDFGPSTFTGEIADEEIDKELDKIFDEALEGE